MLSDDKKSQMFELIRQLRMPLAFLVVLIHVCIPQNWCTPPEWSAIEFIRMHFLCPLAVPLFFLFSGFLFFREGSLSRRDYFRKLSSKARTLFVPYLVFSLMGAGYIWIVKTYGFSRVMENPYSEIHNALDFSIFILKDGGGIAPLWFLRFLILLSIASPIVFWTLKRLGYFAVLLPVAWLLADGATVYSVSLTFWAVGGFLALSDRTDFIFEKTHCFGLVYLVGCGFEFFWRDEVHTWLHALNLLTGVLFVVSSIEYAKTLGKSKIIQKVKSLPDASYFVYLSHFFFVGIAVRVYGAIMPLRFGLFAFIIIGGGVYLICVFLFLSMKKFFPKYLKAILGKC